MREGVREAFVIQQTLAFANPFHVMLRRFSSHATSCQSPDNACDALGIYLFIRFFFSKNNSQVAVSLWRFNSMFGSVGEHWNWEPEDGKRECPSLP